MLTIAILIYSAAMTAANLSIAHFGPWISPINAFVLIGLDLALRDWLQMRLKAWQMGALILASGAITYGLNPAAGMIAIASAVAFTAAAVVDWAVFTRLRGSWLFRANGSNVAGAAVDSLIFPTLAFGVLMPSIVVMQFAAKVLGGAFWAWVLNKQLKASIAAMK
jgi:queuosine precursor transporter